MAVPDAELAANPQAYEPGCPTARVRVITIGIRCM